MKKLDFIGWLNGLLQNAQEFWMYVNDPRLQLVNEERYVKGRELLISIVSRLVKMLKKILIEQESAVMQDVYFSVFL